MAEKLVQIGWRSKTTGEMCDCPAYERSPHADSDPVYVSVDVVERIAEAARRG